MVADTPLQLQKAAGPPISAENVLRRRRVRIPPGTENLIERCALSYCTSNHQIV